MGPKSVILENGAKIYDWDQTLDEVHIFFDLPDGTTKQDLEISIRPKLIQIGLRGNPPYLAQPPWAPVEAAASLWWLETPRRLHLQLQKVREAETWAGAFSGHENLNPLESEKVRKKILLERFQGEHPGFDFSDAELTGTVPNPRTFLK